MTDDLVKRLRETTHMYQVDCELKMKCADRIEELEGMLPEDNRPCSTDRFLVAVVDEIDDHYDRLDAIKCWIEGAWDEAVEGTTLAELEGQDDE